MFQATAPMKRKNNKQDIDHPLLVPSSLLQVIRLAVTYQVLDENPNNQLNENCDPVILLQHPKLALYNYVHLKSFLKYMAKTSLFDRKVHIIKVSKIKSGGELHAKSITALVPCLHLFTEMEIRNNAKNDRDMIELIAITSTLRVIFFTVGPILTDGADVNNIQPKETLMLPEVVASINRLTMQDYNKTALSGEGREVLKQWRKFYHSENAR
jgi:hypothetical protein